MTLPPLLSIGDFARESGLTPKALRLYDELGLLPPARVDGHSGYRWYGRDQLGPARLVATLRLVGMPLARIRAVLEADAGGRAALVAGYWRQVEADTASRREIVQTLVGRLHAEETPMSTDPTPTTPTVGTSRRRGARERQQDALLVRDRMYAVADGFGPGDGPATAALRAYAEQGYPAAEEVARAAAPGGTTLTALTLDGACARLTHVGDGRAYLVRDGHTVRLTHDHTLVAGLIESGDLTAEEARSHPRRTLLNRALGSDDRGPDTAEVPVRPGDRLVLLTDGVHTALDPDELADLVTLPRSPQEVADLLAGAVVRAGEPDNHTVVVVDLA